VNSNRRRDAEIETEEQRRREDAAPRLRDEVRQLLSLRLRLDDVVGQNRATAMSYVRPIMVSSAPALFEVRCMEPRCSGRHDLTRAVLSELRQSQATFAGESSCDGFVRDTPCQRTLAWACEASYRT
jgi:hypothetical protein